jgi:hypothetical protein
MIRFELLDSLSLPGDPDRPNDDAFGVIENAAVVLDGATSLGDPLMPGKSDAAWLAQFGARRLLAHVKDGKAPRDAVRHAMEDAEKSFVALRRRTPAAIWEMPLASMMLVVANDDGFDALWFGDCAALVKRPGEPVTLLGDTLAKRELEAARVARLATKHGLSAAAGHNRPEYLTALRRGRNYANTEKGGWIFGPDPRAAEHVGSASRAAPEDTLVLLATDGLLALVSDYRRYDAEALLAAATSIGLEKIGEELRDIEGADMDGTRFPRFKTSDDATAVLLRVT